MPSLPVAGSSSSSAAMLFAFACFVLVAASTGQVLDNRDTCAHRVVNCDPDVDHFETKISMMHSSSVQKLQYENTHILLDQVWPTRGPWMKSTSQKIIFVRCGCPVPDIPADWGDANIIHVPVSSVMVQMPNTLSKIYLMGQRSKVKAIESTRYISDATPEIQTDIRDGTIHRLDLSLNGKPSTRVIMSFTRGVFQDDSEGFRLQLVDGSSSEGEMLAETECIYPTNSTEPLDSVMDKSFNAIPGWVDAGSAWVLTKGDASEEPSTTLSYDIFFADQLPMNLSLRGEATSCGGDVDFKFERDVAPSNRPIYYRLHDLPGGFPDVLLVEPRSLGPLADDPKVQARLFFDSDPGEETPLGRSELMKLAAIMTGSAETGNTLFQSIEMRYNDVKSIAAKASHRPTVLVGKPGTWNEAARNSWMITVGSTYVGQFLRDANVEYRNFDDSINKGICGSGCGVCPSGQSDTRCSVDINDYLDLFRSSDYWIAAGVGGNCWSASCNFELDSDTLLDQNPDIFSQFFAMQCGSVIALDKSHSISGNPYWETSRLRPDIVLMDLVTLMHPDLEIEDETTFMRILPPPSDTTATPSCPRTLLPVKPDESTVHVTSKFVVNTDASTFETIGAPYFAVLDRIYPSANAKIAESLGVNTEDLKLAMANGEQDYSRFEIAATVRVPNCDSHSCAVDVGQKLDTVGSAEIEKALDFPGISVQPDSSQSTHVLDREGDIIPLADLIPTELDMVPADGAAGGDSNPAPNTSTVDDSGPASDTSAGAGGSEGSDSNSASDTTVAAKNGNVDEEPNSGLGAGAIVGIICGVAAAFIGMYATYKTGYAEGAKATQLKHDQKGFSQEGPEAVA